MTVSQWTVFGICMALAAACGVLGGFQFAGKGVPLNNTYLYSSKKQRESMDLKPLFRQTATVLWILAAAFVFLGVYTLTEHPALIVLNYAALAAALVYAIVSSVIIGKKSR